MAHSLVRGNEHYLVFWSGFDSKEDTSEPQEHPGPLLSLDTTLGKISPLVKVVIKATYFPLRRGKRPKLMNNKFRRAKENRKKFRTTKPAHKRRTAEHFESTKRTVQEGQILRTRPKENSDIK